LEFLRQLENVLSFSEIPLPKHLVGARKAYSDFLAELEAKLAELETEPLGAEFEAVWDANKRELYES